MSDVPGGPSAANAPETSSEPETLLLERPAQVAAALSPLRRQLLEHLVVPASATEVAERMGHSRQKVNYHLRALEKAGLVELVEERQRRGCTERILRARARRLVVDPGLLGRESTATGDRGGEQLRDKFSAAYQLAAAGKAFRDVALLRQRANDADKRLALATLELDLRFESPAALRAFADDVAECVAQLAVKHGAPSGDPSARAYRVLVAARPAFTDDGETIADPDLGDSND